MLHLVLWTRFSLVHVYVWDRKAYENKWSTKIILAPYGITYGWRGKNCEIAQFSRCCWRLGRGWVCRNGNVVQKLPSAEAANVGNLTVDPNTIWTNHWRFNSNICNSAWHSPWYPLPHHSIESFTLSFRLGTISLETSNLIFPSNYEQLNRSIEFKTVCVCFNSMRVMEHGCFFLRVLIGGVTNFCVFFKKRNKHHLFHCHKVSLHAKMII